MLYLSPDDAQLILLLGVGDGGLVLRLVHERTPLANVIPEQFIKLCTSAFFFFRANDLKFL